MLSYREWRGTTRHPRASSFPDRGLRGNSMSIPIKAPPTARFEDRFPPDEEINEAERAARHERTRRAAAAYEAFKAAGGERIIHRTPERLAAAVERRRQRVEALRAESRGEPGENLYRPEPDLA